MGFLSNRIPRRDIFTIETLELNRPSKSSLRERNEVKVGSGGVVSRTGMGAGGRTMSWKGLPSVVRKRSEGGSSSGSSRSIRLYPMSRARSVARQHRFSTAVMRFDARHKSCQKTNQKWGLNFYIRNIVDAEITGDGRTGCKLF